MADYSDIEFKEKIYYLKKQDFGKTILKFNLSMQHSYIYLYKNKLSDYHRTRLFEDFKNNKLLAKTTIMDFGYRNEEGEIDISTLNKGIYYVYWRIGSIYSMENTEEIKLIVK